MASRYLVAGGTGNWNSTTNWAATDGGASGASFPIAGDDVFMTSNSGSQSITVNVASACATVTSSGTWSGVMIMTSTLTTTGLWTYPVGTFSGLGDIITVTSCTFNITPTLSGGLRLGGASQTYTLSRALSMAGFLQFNGSVAITFIGNFLITAGNFTDSMGVSAITMSGDITITGQADFASATSTTITGGKNFLAASATVQGGQTMTITNIGSMTITGITLSSTVNVFTGGIWNTQSLLVNGNTTGTTVINFTGGGAWSGSASLSCSVTFSGATTLSGTIFYAASGTPTMTNNSIITPGASILSIASSCTINGMTFFDVILTAALTLTSNTRNTTTGTFTLPNAAVTFAGTSGWTANLVTSTAYTTARTTTFTDGNEYIIYGGLTSDSSDLPSEAHTWTSSHATNYAYITLQSNATQDIGWFNPIRMSAARGQEIFSFRASITDSPNWTATYGVFHKMKELNRTSRRFQINRKQRPTFYK